MTDTPPVLEARNIAQRYGGVAALDDVSIRLAAGVVTALVGGNGAGKSTLIRILSGSQSPTAGILLMDGKKIRLASPRDAQALGIATVYQDLALVPLMSVWRNFVLADEPVAGWGPLRRIDVRAARNATREGLQKFGITLDAERPAGQLSGGERQVLAIARAAARNARVLILDEPTAALAVGQAERVLQSIAATREQGHAVLLVTHNPRHALAAADRVVVLRLGRIVEQRPASELNEPALSALIAGA